MESQQLSGQGSKFRQQLKVYFEVAGVGALILILVIFCVFSIYWGALYKIPAHPLPGWVVDFDGGTIGQNVLDNVMQSGSSRIEWKPVSASQFSDVGGVAHQVLEENVWVAITINPGTSQRLAASVASPDASYDGSKAISVYSVEARNENAFRTIIRPTVQATLDAISKASALNLSQQVSASPNITNLLQISPQTVTLPVSYELVNLIPFDQPVAQAATFVGLIFQVILSFFLVIVFFNAREMSGLGKSLSTLKLILLRLASTFVALFLISLFYSLLSLAFHLDVSRKFGPSGFVIFWMINYVGMLALGLALESMITVLTMRFIPFFMVTWIIANVSICIFPFEVMPGIYNYGKGAPFYSISRAMRSVIFGTRNWLGLSFGILIVWIVISCITLSLFQYLVRRKEVSASASPVESSPGHDTLDDAAVGKESVQEIRTV